MPPPYCWEKKKTFFRYDYFWLWHAIPYQADKSPGSSRRSSLYPTTSRRCSEAVAAYAASGDIEAVAEMLRTDKLEKDMEEDEFVLPPEKERKRLVLVVSCVGLTMTFLAAIMVGITLGFSQTMDDKVSSKPVFKCF